MSQDTPAASRSAVKLGAWSYRPLPQRYDEMLDEHGQRRPAWERLARRLSELEPESFQRRWHEAQRLIRNNGITYNVYGDPQGLNRPWPLDPIPMILSGQEWATLEQAIAQRARLLNAMLADLYGPQRMLLEGHLPPELIYANRGFLRACHGLPPAGGHHLHVYAADLSRAPDGRWWVLSDRTQAPSGAGYALENRLVMTRSLPEVFRDHHVQRLATYFQKYRELMLRLGNGRENPRVVLLTPGPYNETYFEHAFLAQYLGFTLVRGDDLTVRDDRVYLKTLGGLLPVDVIVRRQDDAFCDPLELRGESKLGIPGLVNAVRRGNVAVANALGSGLLETPATLAFMPKLCRHLLGEDLQLPSVATWWCGQPGPRREALAMIDRLVIKHAYPQKRDRPVFMEQLGAEERQRLLERLRERPEDWVAQEKLAISSAPTLGEGQSLQGRHVLLRVYAVAREDGNYSVMPGGMTRVSPSGETLVVSMQQGGGSKDTWVLSDKPVPAVSLLRPPPSPIDVSRASFDLPSRIADNLFWLGRMVARVEAGIRIVRYTIQGLSEEGEIAQMLGVEAGLEVLVGLGYMPRASLERFARRCRALQAQQETTQDTTPEAALLEPLEPRTDKTVHPAAGEKTAPSTGGEQPPESSLEAELVSLVFDEQRQQGLRPQLSEVRRLAWLVRDRLSADTWRALNRLDQEFHPRPPLAMQLSTCLEMLDGAINGLAAFSGLVMEGMTRGQGWRFLDIGRCIERTLQLTELLAHGLGVWHEHEQLRLPALLEIADSGMTYRSRYLTSVQPSPVIDLLLLDEANPRSVAYQLRTLSEHMPHLPQARLNPRGQLEDRQVLEAYTAVRLTELEALARADEPGQREALVGLLQRLRELMPKVSNSLTLRYLSHATPLRALPRPWADNQAASLP